MASNIYTIGSMQYTRSVKQGAPKKDAGLLRRRPVMIRLTDQEYNRYMDAKKHSFLSPSEFGALVLFLGLMQLSVADNCSKT